MILENKGVITDQNYYEDKEYISASMIKQALQGSKKQFDYAMQNNKESEAMLVGSAFHAIMLEPETFGDLYAFEPDVDRRTKAGKEYIAEWKEEHSRIPNHLSGKHSNMLWDMKDSLNAHPKYKELIKNFKSSIKEGINLFEIDGIKCKAKVDYYDPIQNIIIDIKTCNSVNLPDIIESIDKYMYGVQAAFYLDALNADAFYFAFITKKKPYDVLIVKYGVSLEKDREAYKLGMKNIQRFNEEPENSYAMFNEIIEL